MIQGERGVLIAKFKAQVTELGQELTDAEFIYALSEIVTSSLEVNAKDSRSSFERIKGSLASEVLDKQSSLAWHDDSLTVSEAIDALAEDVEST